MLILRPSTDKVQLISSAVCDLDIVASYVDRDTTSFAVGLAESQYTNIATAATTDIVAAPAAGKARNVKSLNIRNAHATVAVDVTVLIDVSAIDYELIKVTLLAGQTLEYVEGVGFFVIEDTALLNRTLRLASDYVNATIAFTDITGLSCPLLGGKFYNFFANLFHVNDAATTGSQFGYNIGAVPTSSIVGTQDTVTPSVTAAAMSAGVITARDTAVTAQTTGSTSQRLAMLAGMIQPSADGTFVLRGASEVAVAAGLTVKAGSWLHIWEPTG